jgi:hypothetical protein
MAREKKQNSISENVYRNKTRKYILLLTRSLQYACLVSFENKKFVWITMLYLRVSLNFCHQQCHGQIFWPDPITKIKTLPHVFLSNFPVSLPFCLYWYINFRIKISCLIAKCSTQFSHRENKSARGSKLYGKPGGDGAR